MMPRTCLEIHPPFRKINIISPNPPLSAPPPVSIRITLRGFEMSPLDGPQGRKDILIAKRPLRNNLSHYGKLSAYSASRGVTPFGHGRPKAQPARQALSPGRQKDNSGGLSRAFPQQLFCLQQIYTLCLIYSRHIKT